MDVCGSLQFYGTSGYSTVHKTGLRNPKVIKYYQGHNYL